MAIQQLNLDVKGNSRQVQNCSHELSPHTYSFIASCLHTGTASQPGVHTRSLEVTSAPHLHPPQWFVARLSGLHLLNIF